MSAVAEVGYARTARAPARSRPPSEGPSPRYRAFAPWWVWSAMLAGAALLALAYSNAQRSTSNLHVDLFWIGELAFVLPAAARLLRPATTREERVALIVALGLFDFVPKLLRSPGSPVYFDEFAHWLQTQNVISSGHAFLPNPVIAVVESFPGLHVLVAGLHDVTGIPAYSLGSVLIALLHAASLVAVFLIAERLTRSHLAGGIAALLYSVNPSFLFFDSEYSYESLALPLVLWTLYASVVVSDPSSHRAEKRGWLAIGCLVGAACVATHHLSAYYLAAWLTLSAGAVSFKRRRLRVRSHPYAWWLAGGVTAMAAGWLAFVASGTVGYLSPYVGSGISEIASQLSGAHSTRQLFHASTLPAYEHLCAFAVPFLLLAGCVYAFRSALRSGLPPAARSFWMFAAAYFLSLPFMFSNSGNEGARRSWGFSFIGLAIVLAPVLATIVRRHARRRIAGMALLVAVAVVLVGDVAADLNETYRFPGPYVYGSDTRSLAPELYGLIDWFKRTQGTRKRFVADRYTSFPLEAYGDDFAAAPSAGFPVYTMFFRVTPPSRGLLRQLLDSGYQYLMVDKRSAQSLPRIGVYFTPDEPDAYARTKPIPEAALTKFDYLPYLQKIFESDNYVVYRFLRGPLQAAAEAR